MSLSCPMSNVGVRCSSVSGKDYAVAVPYSKRPAMKSRKLIRRITFGFLWLLAYFTVLGAAFMLLWNALIPDLFQGPSLTYVQAIGLLVLAHLLLRGGFFYVGPGWRYPYWRRKWRGRHASMPPEDRAALERECGRQPDDSEERAEQTPD